MVVKLKSGASVDPWHILRSAQHTLRFLIEPLENFILRNSSMDSLSSREILCLSSALDNTLYTP